MLLAAVTARAGALAVDVDLDANPGCPLVVLGANGAGKSTWLRCVAGLHPQEGGRVELDGVVWFDGATGVDLPPRRRHVGLVPQQGVLFPYLDVAANVAYGLAARGAAPAARRTRLEEMLELLDLVALRARRPASLSGGERQRVALARALAVDPPLLLLDEPLSALDAAARGEVRRLLRRAVAGRQSGCTVLVTHDARDALELGAAVAVVDGGRVVQRGTPAELLAAPRTASVAALAGHNWLPGTCTARHGDLATVSAGPVRMEALVDVEVPPSVGAAAAVLVDPRDITLSTEPPHGSARNVLRGPVGQLTPHRGGVRVLVESRPDVVAEVTAAAVTELGLSAGVGVFASFKATAARAVA